MIVREIESACQRQVIESFDFFNDYYDTHRWLLGRGNTPVAERLEEAYNKWVDEKRAKEAEERNEEERKRIIAFADERKEFITDVDGFVYWWPDSENLSGHLASHHLRWLADELDKRNKEWQKTIEEELS